MSIRRLLFGRSKLKLSAVVLLVLLLSMPFHMGAMAMTGCDMSEHSMSGHASGGPNMDDQASGGHNMDGEKSGGCGMAGQGGSGHGTGGQKSGGCGMNGHNTGDTSGDTGAGGHGASGTGSQRSASSGGGMSHRSDPQTHSSGGCGGGDHGDTIPAGLEGIAIPPPPLGEPEDYHVDSGIEMGVASEVGEPGVLSPGYLTLWGHVYKSNTCTCPAPCPCDSCDCRGTLRGIKMELWEDISWWPDDKLQTVYTRDSCSCARSGADCTCRPGVTCTSDCGYYRFYVDVGSGMKIYVKIIFEGKSGATGTDASGTVKLTVHLEGGGAYVTESTHWDQGPGTVGKYFYFGSLGGSGSRDEIAHIYLDDWKGFAYARDDYGFTNAKVTSRYYPSDTGAPYSTGYDIRYNWWNGYLDTEITDSPLHEYGHSLQYGMYGGAWASEDCSTACGPQPGGCDWRGSNGDGVRDGDCENHMGQLNTCSCDAVIEGWARFFPTMIHNDSVYNWQSYTVGTNIDLEASTQGEKNEWGFGGILWDIWEDVDSRDTDDIIHSMEFHDPGTVQEFYNGYHDDDPLCPIFAKHGIGGTYWHCATYCDCTNASYCDGVAAVCDSGPLGIPQGAGCEGIWPSQCNCYSQGIIEICSHMDPATTCVEGCWINPCDCGGAGCPLVGCYDCTDGWCDAVSPSQGCNGVYLSQCNCYGHGITSICSNADTSTTCVEGCWINPCACGGVGCPGTGCYDCGYAMIQDWCGCGNHDCACGYENDCADYAVDNYMPCGGATSNDWCNCGLSSCTCGFERDCLNSVDDYEPCLGASVNDWCDCGATDCTCGYQTDCINGIDDYIPCGGATVNDTCDCGGTGCACGFEVDCANGIDDFIPCGGAVPDPCSCGGFDCSCLPENDCATFPNPGSWIPCGGVIPCECGGVGCACPDYCSLASPPPADWILLASDPDEGAGTNLLEIYGQRYSGVIYFRVAHYRPWATIMDIDTAILIDADQNPATGLPDGTYPGQITGIGADYLIIVGWEGTEMWKWDSVAVWWDTANPISLAYLDAPDNATVFVVGVYLSDVVTVGALDCAVTDVVSSWDWMPDTGHFTLPLPAWMPCGGTVPDVCDCGGVNCNCGSENDCAAFAVDDFMPCGGTLPDPCDCGINDCTCGSEDDCAAFAVDNFMPCGGATVNDTCDCGGTGCACGFEVDCANGTDDYMPCGGTVPDPCSCGGFDCPCLPDNDCAAFPNPGNWIPCGGVIPCECGGVGCGCPDYCSLASPPPGSWILLAIDPDEGIGTNLREIYGQRYSGVLYFRVEHYRPWGIIMNIDTAILIDADQNPGTGLPDGFYPGQVTGIGADYLIIVGAEGTEIWQWDSIAGFWDLANPISLAYLDAPGGSNVFVVGVYLADVATAGALDGAVTDPFSGWDWIPDTGHFTLPLPAWMPCGGTVPDWCDCGGVNCNCGFENDCAAFAVDDFMPCGGTLPDPCDCGFNDCTCGSEDDCAAFAVDNFMPCGGTAVNDTCDCGGTGCACGFEVDCINGINDYMPCSGAPINDTCDCLLNDCTCGFEVDCINGVDNYMPCGGATVEDWCDCGYPDCDCGYELDCVNGVDDFSLPGDANGDRTVDIFDIGFMSAHWDPGPPVGPLGYHPDADLNDDGAVDIFDIGIASANWGETCGPG